MVVAVCKQCYNAGQLHVLCGASPLLKGPINASRPADLEFFYQCSALTASLVRSGQLAMALNSWVLDSVSPGTWWEPSTDSMLRFHESNKHSAELYSSIMSPLIVPVSG